LPSRARCRLACGSAGVGDHAGIEGVADPPLERAERFLGGLAFGDLAVVEGAPGAVLEPDLGDGGAVERVVQLAIPAARQPVGLAAT
jgi:hypothetical protein